MKMKKSLLTERFQQLAGIKPLYEIEDNIEKYIDREDDISDIRGGKTITINFNRKIYGNQELENDLKDYISATYGGHFELDWRDDQEVEIHMGNSPNPPPSDTPSVNDLNKYVAWKKKNFKSIHSPVSSKLK